MRIARQIALSALTAALLSSLDTSRAAAQGAPGSTDPPTRHVRRYFWEQFRNPRPWPIESPYPPEYQWSMHWYGGRNDDRWRWNPEGSWSDGGSQQLGVPLPGGPFGF
jgi:hypothetical protein